MEEVKGEMKACKAGQVSTPEEHINLPGGKKKMMTLKAMGHMEASYGYVEVAQTSRS